MQHSDAKRSLDSIVAKRLIEKNIKNIIPGHCQD